MADFFLGYNASGKELWRKGSKYPYVDLRNKLPGDPQPSQGTVLKDLGVVAHYNGPAVRQTDIDQLYIDARYHIQKDWGGGYYTNGIQYEWATGSDGTKYRLRNPGASLWHCGNPHYNVNAFAVTFLFGEGQHATRAAKESMAELCDALLDIQGLSHAYMKGHLDVSSSACPGTAYPEFVQKFRAGEDFETDTPAKPKPQPTDKVRWVNYVYSPDDGWGRKIATAMAEAGFAVGVRGGLTEKAAKAVADAREQASVYTFLIGSDAVERAKKYQREFTDLDIDYNTSGAVRIVTPSYRDRAKWRIADFCEEFKLDKGAAIGAFERAMGKGGGGAKMSKVDKGLAKALEFRGIKYGFWNWSRNFVLWADAIPTIERAREIGGVCSSVPNVYRLINGMGTPEPAGKLKGGTGAWFAAHAHNRLRNLNQIYSAGTLFMSDYRGEAVEEQGHVAIAGETGVNPWLIQSDTGLGWNDQRRLRDTQEFAAFSHFAKPTEWLG